MTDKELLELARLKEVLDYDQFTGLFTWRLSNSNRKLARSNAGGGVNSHGYMQINIDNLQYKSHRLAWFYMTGEWPDQIDHMNGIRTDNRFSNLRSVCIQYNNHNQRKAHSNNSTGFLGVVPKSNGKFVAEIRVNGKKKHIGTFKTAEDASVAYKSAKAIFHKGALA